MKKILTYTAAAALALSFTTAVPAPAHANEGAKGQVNVCKFISDIFGVSVGECVSQIRGKPNDGPVDLCKAALEAFPDAFKLGQCVSYLRNLD